MRRGYEDVLDVEARTGDYEGARDETTKPHCPRSRPAPLPSAGPRGRAPPPAPAPSLLPPPATGTSLRALFSGAAPLARHVPQPGFAQRPAPVTPRPAGEAGPRRPWGAPEGAGSGAPGPRRHHGAAAAAARRPQRRRARRLPQGHRPPAAPPPLRPQRDPQHRARLRGDPPLPAVGEWRRGAGERPRGHGGAGRAAGAAPPGGSSLRGAARAAGRQGPLRRDGVSAERPGPGRGPPAARGRRSRGSLAPGAQRSRPRGAAGTDPGAGLLSECLLPLVVVVVQKFLLRSLGKSTLTIGCL